MARKIKKKKGFLHRDMTIVEKVILFILFVALLVSTYFITPFARINAIRVSGTEDIDANQLAKSSGVVVNQTLLATWLLDGQIKEKIKQNFLRVESVETILEENNVLHIRIKEYPTIATVELGSDYFSILASGVVLQENNKKYIGSLPNFKWQGNIESLRIAAIEFAKVPEILRKQVSEIVYQESDKLVMTLYMNDGNQVKVNYTDFAQKFTYYDNMKKNIEGKKGVIDLTVGAYFVPYN